MAGVPKQRYTPATTARGGKPAAGVGGALAGIIGLCCMLVFVRWCRRRRFYKKVQRTMDEEELAFQKSLAKNYTEEMAELDDSERERLKLLENYMETMGANLGADEGKDSANLENVEAFLDQLSKAAAGADGDVGESDEAPGDLEAGEASHATEITPAAMKSAGETPAAPVEWKEVPR